MLDENSVMPHTQTIYEIQFRTFSIHNPRLAMDCSLCLAH